MELVGALHVHTRFSDGTATPAELVALASELGLDFLGINDHRNLRARESGWSGLHDGVTVLAGAELNDPSLANHILVYGADTIPPVTDSRTQLDHVHASGGLPVVAHPCETGTRLPKMGPYPWRHGALEGIGGVEVWNYMSDWKSGVRLRDLKSRIAHPDRYVGGPDQCAVELWLRTGGCALAGVDAHGLRFGMGRMAVEVFPYRDLLRKIQTHVLLDSAPSGEGAERAIVDAIAGGRVFSSVPGLGDARGFRFRRKGGILSLDVPEPASLRVRTAGSIAQRPVAAGENEMRLPDDERAFLELLKDGRTWICCGLD